MRRKQNLASDLGIQKENMEVTTHFSEIIKFQFGKEHHTLLCILISFLQILLIDYLEKCVVTPNFRFGLQ